MFTSSRQSIFLPSGQARGNCFGVNRFAQPPAIDRMNQRGQRRRTAQFVTLQVADQMPTNRLASVLRGQHTFGPQLLRSALAEVAAAGREQRLHCRLAMVFGCGHQQHIVAAPPTPRGRRANLLAHTSQVVGNSGGRSSI